MASQFVISAIAIGLPIILAGGVSQAQPITPVAATTSAPVCWKPAQSRGVGTLPTICAAGEELSSGLCYPICKSGYAGEGPVCWSKCPAGTEDIGLFCRRGARVTPKKSQGRGVGKLPECRNERDAGLCYDACPPGKTGVGPLCWPACEGRYATSCGALCAVSSEACAKAVAEMTARGLLVAVEAVITQRINPQALADLARVFAWPVCEQREGPGVRQ
ncbi:MAG: hypothetical protein IPM54_45365 [Polyangiaceae bacterium]|nr:hypothetical protein [Polyangiaceae bacterium]